jgi:2-polyprenyl-6-methoxyphenol hydroxylase-like FAD-dependent oxidoreductase
VSTGTADAASTSPDVEVIVAEILVLGAGLNGLSVAMLLARDGHDVTVVERDAAEPPTNPQRAWEEWDRHGVNQFRMLHLMLPRWRAQMEEELPEVLSELEAWGGLRVNLLAAQPRERTGGWREGDEIFETITGRRPVIEAALAAVAARTAGVRIRRGSAVTGLLARREETGGVPRVRGVLTEGGDAIRADLVVDTCGRRSSLPAWLEAIDAARPVEEREDCGFIYYGRHFRSADGRVPAALTGLLVAHDSLSILTAPADNGTWGVVFVTSARDRALRALRDPVVWERLLARYPLAAHWADGDPISGGVDVMAAIEDRHRTLVVDGHPVATGVVLVGDSWACTNPSLGRGSSIGLLHARLLRDLLRDVESTDAEKLARRFDEVTRTEVEPLYRMTLHFDRHRLGEIDADIDGRPYEPGDPVWTVTKAMSAGATTDPDVLRAYVTIASLQKTSDEVLAAPGLVNRVIAAGSRVPSYPEPGPSRDELLRVVSLS